MSMPLISIVIPAYNLETLLAKTLDSVLVQTYANLEVIVVNDGSKDATGAVIDSYAAKDSRIKPIHKENGGVTSARLRGIAEATGDWIGFVDGDDYIEPDMYQRLLDNALQYDADISHCGYQMVFPNRVDYYYNTGKLIQQDNLTGMQDLIAGEFIEPGLCNKLYRRTLFAGLSERMDSRIKVNEDLLMNYWLFKQAKRSVYEDFCPYLYIVRAGSAANSGVKEHMLRNPLQVTNILLADVPADLEPVVYRKLIRLLITGASMNVRSLPDFARTHRTACRKELRHRLWAGLTGRACGLKLKIMALWTAVWPASYGWVHRSYEKATGLDKIYDLE